jgi:hypothetical protein
VEMRTEVSHALRGHPVRCDRANYYGMPTGPFVVLQAASKGRRIVALRRIGRTREVPMLPQHPVGPVATGPYQGRLGPRPPASVTTDNAGRDGGLGHQGRLASRWPDSAGALDYGFAATSRNR